MGNRTSEQIDNSVSTYAYNEKNQLLNTSGGGLLRFRGTLNEPGTVTVNGQAAQMLAGNTFEALVDVPTVPTTVPVVARDTSGNATTKNYQVTGAGSAATYSYDANGNLIQKVEGSDTWTYEWNAENQLTRVLTNGAEVARYKYDPNGRRVERVAGATTTLWAYDGEDTLRETAGSAVARYIQGPGIDEPLAQEDGAGALSYFHADGLASVVRTSSPAGTVTPRRYDAFGALEVGSSNGYAFTGREWDTAAALAYHRARYYDPKIGRFLNEDPLEIKNREIDELNAYVYVANNPINAIDPTGLASLTNRWDKPVPYKPETCPPGAPCPIKLCAPGMKCDDIDGVYIPADCKTNPYKIIDTCDVEVTPAGELSLTCGISRPLQWIRGGRMSDSDMNDHKDWAPPNQAPGCQSACR